MTTKNKLSVSRKKIKKVWGVKESIGQFFLFRGDRAVAMYTRKEDADYAAKHLNSQE